MTYSNSRLEREADTYAAKLRAHDCIGDIFSLMALATACLGISGIFAFFSPVWSLIPLLVGVLCMIVTAKLVRDLFCLLADAIEEDSVFAARIAREL